VVCEDAGCDSPSVTTELHPALFETLHNLGFVGLYGDNYFSRLTTIRIPG
jgi:hypothetical protein